MTQTAKEKQFQTYSSPKSSFRMMTPKGRRINFIKGKHITCIPEEIEYLDDEIAAGIRFITKGEPVTSEDLDPMAALKKRLRAEILAEQAANLNEAAESPEDIAPKGKEASPVGALSTAALTKLSAASHTQASK